MSCSEFRPALWLPDTVSGLYFHEFSLVEALAVAAVSIINAHKLMSSANEELLADAGIVLGY